MVSFALIMIGKRVVWRVDGLAEILAGSPRYNGALHHFPGASTHTLITAKEGPNMINFLSPPPSRGCVNGAKNALFPSLLMVGKAGRMANRWIGRDFSVGPSRNQGPPTDNRWNYRPPLPDH